MPSLFSRARTSSSAQQPAQPDSLDEFGRVPSRSAPRNLTSPTPSKKDKRRAKDAPPPDFDQPPPLPDGSFLPLNLDPIARSDPDHADYGYLAYERHVVLGLEQLEILVSVVVQELENRGGITTPFIFSTTALDISASAIKRLIRSFLDMCAAQGTATFRAADHAWREEAKFAGPHELGMCLRWGLARVVRVFGGQDVRGLIAWDHYVTFRDSEAARGYPPAHFETMLAELDPTLQYIIVRVLSLLTRLTANGTSSGHSPPTLSPLFGPLLFGLGPATLAFHHTYVHYLRSANATEHILLAFIRWQDTPRLAAMYPSGSAASLGVPIRLREWIKGYPAMLTFPNEQKNAKPHPRKGAKTIVLSTVRRNVRSYSPDLVKTAATWASRAKTHNGIINGLATSKEWERIAPPTLRLPPRYSETFKKRMSLPSNFHPETSPGMSYSNSSTSTTSAQAPSLKLGVSQTSSASDHLGLEKGESDARFRSLTDLKWGEFETMGFSGLGDEKKLQFDLTESAREARTAKRQTMSWNDFSTAGFSRNDAPLNTTLQFSSPITLSLSNWPARDAELTKKIIKKEKQLPPFGWDTEPVMGGEEIIEEAFVDVFCDLVYGGGWMDLERSETLDRDVNWALVEFKSLPANRSAASGSSDPRTAAALILFEEFVPFEYRQQLSVKPSTRRRIPFFSPSKKQWKQAATLNGRPYVVGHVPRSPSYREMEFEGLLRGGGGTKVISLGSKASTRVISTISNATTAADVQRSRSPVPPVPPLPKQPSSSLQAPGTTTDGTLKTTLTPPIVTVIKPSQSFPRAPKSEETHSDSTASPSVKKSTSRFRITNVISSPTKRLSSAIPPAEYSAVDFETRLASYSDSEGRNSGGADGEGDKKKQKRRESKDDAWVDILVNSQQRRIVGQDVERGVSYGSNGLKVGGGDPDIASLEVAQVLAAVRRDRQRSPSLGSNSTGGGGGGNEAEDFVPHDASSFGVDMDAHVQGFVIDEIQRIPRRGSGASTSEGHGLVYEDEEDGDDEDDGGEEEYTADDDDEELGYSQSQLRRPQPPVEDSELPVTPARPSAAALRQQRRMGYFDLHPERKQLYGLGAGGHDGDGDGGEEEEEGKAKGKATSHGQQDLTPSPDVPSFDLGREQRAVEMERTGLVRADSVTLPSLVGAKSSVSGGGGGGGLSATTTTPTKTLGKVNENGGVTHPVGPRAPAPAGGLTGSGSAGSGTKTAALIEMYRERERQATANGGNNAPTAPTNVTSTIVTPSATLSPSTSTLITPVTPPRPPRSSSLPGATNLNTTSVAVDVPTGVEDQVFMEMPKPVETGRVSPARYVHGAPLHNVLEEPEEED